MEKQNRQSYRDRYFSDNEAVKVAAANRRGYRIIYRYLGLWRSWESVTGTLAQKKRVIGLAELTSVCLYLGCAAADSPVNRVRIAGGLGLLSVLPWLLEVSGVLRFLLAKEYVRDLSVNAISKCRFSPKWDVVFYRAAYRCYTALYTTSLAGLKPVKP